MPSIAILRGWIGASARMSVFLVNALECQFYRVQMPARDVIIEKTYSCVRESQVHRKTLGLVKANENQIDWRSRRSLNFVTTFDEVLLFDVKLAASQSHFIILSLRS